MGIPALPMVNPASLLRNAAGKREAWADLLALQAGFAAVSPTFSGQNRVIRDGNGGLRRLTC